MNRLIKINYQIFFVLLILISIDSIFAQSLESNLESTLKSIFSENINHHVQILASDSLEGRGTGQPSGNLAAKYLESEFGKMGLKPTGDNNSYYQYIPMHSSNPLAASQLLTLKQIKNVYQCKIKNWKEIGGKDLPIVPVSRNPNSGTYLYFKDHILLGEDYCDEILIQPTTESIIEFVRLNENAIGYGAGALADDVFNAFVDNVAPTEEYARNDTYPIT